MAKIISVSNQKGGVGKTTTAINVAASLGVLDRKTLIVDIDPQGNTTSGLGFDKRNIKISTYDMLIKNVTAKEILINTEFKGLDLLPSSMNLAAVELELVDIPQREAILRQKLEKVHKDYDYIIIDCPPSLGLITANALCSSHSVIIPLQCEFYALEGLSQIVNTFNKIKEKLNTFLEIEGILITMYNSRFKLTQQVEEQLKTMFPGKIFSSTISRTVRISEAPGFGMPVYYFDKYCKGTDEYLQLAKEIIRNNEE